MNKLLSVLHDVIDAIPAFQGNKNGEMHSLAEEIADELGSAIAAAVEKAVAARLDFVAAIVPASETPAAPKSDVTQAV